MAIEAWEEIPHVVELLLPSRDLTVLRVISDSLATAVLGESDR